MNSQTHSSYSSNIEFNRARNEAEVVSVNGVRMCSYYNPFAEATQWVSAQKERVQGADVIFLLGLGAGYHAEALAEEFPRKKIHVIEKEGSLIQWFWNRSLIQTRNLEIFHLSHCRKSLLQKVKSDLCKPYAVVENPYSMRLHPNQMLEIKTDLLGRERESFYLLQSLRDEEIEELNTANNRELLSFKSLPNERFNNDPIWSCLRELFK